MKNFIKQNLILFIVACTTVIISLGMFYLLIRISYEREETRVRLSELREKIEQLNAYKPYPSKKNIELIKEDINTAKVKTFLLENIFGNIYTKPLSAFIQCFKQSDIQTLKEKLEKLEKENIPTNKTIIKEMNKQLAALTVGNNADYEAYFIKTWKAYIEDKKKEEEQISLSEILSKFMESQKYDVKILQAAKYAFMTEMKKQTLEPLNIEVINDYILNALGIPLYFSKVKSKTMVITVQDEINRILAENNVSINGDQLVFFSEIVTVPTDDQITYIINYSRFLEDFYKRLATAKIESVESYKKINGIKGTEDDNFLIFRYQINVVASQEALRNFLSSLQKAYTDNRMYVVKTLTLLTMDDGSTDLPSYIPQKTSNQLQQIKILLGGTDMIKASITVDYIIFKKKILN